jgi:hypothetical protein
MQLACRVRFGQKQCISKKVRLGFYLSNLFYKRHHHHEKTASSSSLTANVQSSNTDGAERKEQEHKKLQRAAD